MDIEQLIDNVEYTIREIRTITSEEAKLGAMYTLEAILSQLVQDIELKENKNIIGIDINGK